MRELTAVVLNYNGGALLLDNIGSLYGQAGVRCQVVLVDDGSSDGSVETVERAFPNVRIHREQHNTRQVNRLRNLGLSMATTERVFLTDNDVVYEANCLETLMRAMDENAELAACMPCLRYLDARQTVYLAGTHLHFVATTIAPDRDTSVNELDPTPRSGIGGGIALFDRTRLNYVGGFDEGYELAWGDDGELHQRLVLAGYQCSFIPEAIGYHEYKPFGRTRHYRAKGQVQNRLRFLLTHYEVRTLVVLAPALIVFEFAQVAFYVLKGIPHLYAKGVWGAMKRMPEVFQRRREVQALRRAADRYILHSGPLYVRSAGGSVERIMGYSLRSLSWVLDVYWSVARHALRRSPRAPA